MDHLRLLLLSNLVSLRFLGTEYVAMTIAIVQHRLMGLIRIYISYQLVVKELWRRKQTSPSGSALGIGSFTAIIPGQPVDNYYLYYFIIIL